MLLARDNCKSRLWIWSELTRCHLRNRAYKGEKMMEVAVRLGEEDLKHD